MNLSIYIYRSCRWKIYKYIYSVKIIVEFFNIPVKKHIGLIWFGVIWFDMVRCEIVHINIKIKKMIHKLFYTLF